MGATTNNKLTTTESLAATFTGWDDIGVEGVRICVIDVGMGRGVGDFNIFY